MGWHDVDLRQVILGALGLVACGPTVGDGEGGGDAEGEGGASGEAGGSEAGTSASGSASASASAEGEGSSATSSASSATAESGGSTGGSGGCGVAPPPDIEPPTCADPVPILQASDQGDVPTGLEQCADGRVHRTASVACEYPAAMVGTCGGLGGPTDACAIDADCDAAPHGYCNAMADFVSYCDCHYGCATDADCGEGQLCLCAGPQSRCVTAHCKVDADCDGWACVRGEQPSACGAPPAFFACQGPFDGCDAAAGCGVDSCLACLYAAEACAWACTEDDEVCADCGRPYLVDGVARVATAVARDDWAGEALEAVVPEKPRERAALADHWRRCGLMEHASVAAFARYVLDLLALGAPPDLVQAAQAAMADEIEHARLCFALASRYVGAPCGPGPLASGGALEGRDAERILADVVVEGCVGETLAAAEAFAALEHARDPVVRGVLQRIADDELRHAVLAWQHVKWALHGATGLGRPRLASILERSVAAVKAKARVGVDSLDLRAHGVLDGRARAAVVAQSLSEIVEPCMRALLLGRHVDEPHHAVLGVLEDVAVMHP